MSARNGHLPPGRSQAPASNPRGRAHAKPEDVQIEVQFVRVDARSRQDEPSQVYRKSVHTRPCGLCGQPVQTGLPGPELILAHTNDVVCEGCAEQHAPELLEMHRDYTLRPLTLEDWVPTPPEGAGIPRGTSIYQAYPLDWSTGPGGSEIPIVVMSSERAEVQPGLGLVSVAIRPGVSRRSANRLLEHLLERLAEWFQVDRRPEDPCHSGVHEPTGASTRKANRHYLVPGLPLVSMRSPVRIHARPNDVDLAVRFVGNQAGEGQPSPSDGAAETVCAVCGQPVSFEPPGPRLYVAYTDQVVCPRCGRQHEPELMDLADGYHIKATHGEGASAHASGDIRGGNVTLLVATPKEGASDRSGVVDRVSLGHTIMPEPQTGMAWVTAFVQTELARRDALRLLEMLRCSLIKPVR